MKDEKVASECMNSMMESYGRFLLTGRCPNIVDGLKNVHRRVLQNIENIKFSNKKKVASVTGMVIVTHPHSDKAISGVITDMARPYHHMVPLLTPKGKVGSYSKPQGAAAPRYLDVWCSDFTKDVYFNVNTKAIKYRDTVTDEGKEPINYIPTIPMAMLINTLSIGVGAKTIVLPLNFGNLCTLTIEYIRRRNEGVYNIHGLENLLLPDSPVEGYLLNSKDLIKQYKSGIFNGKVISAGDMDISEKSITLRHVSMNNDFIKCTETMFRKLKKDKHPIFKYIGLPESYADKATGIMRGEVVVPLNKNVSPFDVLDKIKKLIKFRGAITPIPLYVTPRGVGVYADPIRLLDEWYNARYSAVNVSLKYTQENLLIEYRKCEALLIMKDNVKTIQKVFRDVSMWEDAIIPLAGMFNLTRFQVRYLSKVTFAQTSKTAREDLKNMLDKSRAALMEHRKKFVDVGNIMISEIEKISNKYKSHAPRKLKIQKSNISIIFDKGVIQADSNKDLKKVRSEFRHTPYIVLHHNPRYNKVKYIMQNGNLIDNIYIDLDNEYCSAGTIFRSRPATYGLSLISGKCKLVPRVKWTLDACLVDNTMVYLLKDTGVLTKSNTDGICNRSVKPISIISGELSSTNTYICIYSDKINHITIRRLEVGEVLFAKNMLYLGPADKPVVVDMPTKLRNRCTITKCKISEDLLGDEFKKEFHMKKLT